MWKSIIGITLLTTYARAACWSEPDYPCCSEGVEIVSSDENGDWGIENNNWCGIPKPEDTYCWAVVKGYKCCPSNALPQYYDMDGEWGLIPETQEWCGFKDSITRWNDRAKYSETLDEWNQFKIDWETYKSDYQRLSVFPGADSSQLNFGWYSLSNDSSYVRIGKESDMSDAIEFSGIAIDFKNLEGNFYYSNKVTVTGLTEESTYYYSRKLNGVWDEPHPIKTQNSKNFKFLFFGDPQIGGSNSHISVDNPNAVLTIEEGTRNDAFNWERTINKSTDFVPDASLLLTAGDQIDQDFTTQTEENDIYQEHQYSAFLRPFRMGSYPVASAVGNHDTFSPNYRNHFNYPNAITDAISEGPAGQSYYFVHNNVLIVVLETNYNMCSDLQNAVDKAIKAYPNTDWRVALFHQDIYGAGVYHNQGNEMDSLRECLLPVLTDNEFDIVLNGHDHVYSSSHFLRYNGSNGKGYDLEKISNSTTMKDPNGVTFFTANCSTGSKLYAFIEDPIDYINTKIQTFTSNFAVIEFEKDEANTEVKLVFTTYDVETYEKIDGPYTIIKTELRSSEKVFSYTWIILTILIILFVLLLLYYLYRKYNQKNKKNSPEDLNNRAKIQFKPIYSNTSVYLPSSSTTTTTTPTNPTSNKPLPPQPVTFNNDQTKANGSTLGWETTPYNNTNDRNSNNNNNNYYYYNNPSGQEVYNPNYNSLSGQNVYSPNTNNFNGQNVYSPTGDNSKGQNVYSPNYNDPQFTNTTSNYYNSYALNYIDNHYTNSPNPMGSNDPNSNNNFNEQNQQEDISNQPSHYDNSYLIIKDDDHNNNMINRNINPSFVIDDQLNSSLIKRESNNNSHHQQLNLIHSPILQSENNESQSDISSSQLIANNTMNNPEEVTNPNYNNLSRSNDNFEKEDGKKNRLVDIKNNNSSPIHLSLNLELDEKVNIDNLKEIPMINNDITNSNIKDRSDIICTPLATSIQNDFTTNIINETNRIINKINSEDLMETSEDKK